MARRLASKKNAHADRGFLPGLIEELARLAEMGELERELRRFGFRSIAGTDEVGRGCLAGPVVAAAVILEPDCPLFGLDDSKLLDPAWRLRMLPLLVEKARCVTISVIEPVVIDRINILEASKLAMLRSVSDLGIRPEIVVTDAVCIDRLHVPQIAVLHGDSRVCAIAAASIVAKVYRDALMDSYDRLYPEYDFSRNKGYATETHRQALEVLGPTPIHRRTFGSVKSVGLFD